MKRIRIWKYFLLILSFIWAGCSTTSHVPANDKLYTGATVIVKGPSSLTARQKKQLRQDLSGLTRPKPNSRLLGIPFKLMFYNMFYHAKKGLFKNLRNSLGQPPVLLSQLDLEQNTKVLQSYMINKGYFLAQVTGDTVIRRKKASAKYTAEAGDQYKINSVHFPADSDALCLAIAKTASNTLLKKGAPFDLDVIKGERTRIDAILKEEGFYFFSPDYLLIKTDSAIGNHLVDMYLTIKPETQKQSEQVFKIKDVYIYGNYSLNSARRDTLKANDTLFKGYHIIDPKKKFKPFVYAEAMQFKAGDIYNRTAHNQTLNRLINLNTFKFVKNRFEVAAADSPRLDAYYYLTPMPSKSLRAEITTITRSNNLNGNQLNLSWQHRNMFKSAMQANVTAYIGTDVQFSGAFSGYNTYRTGVQADFAIPLFVVPFQTLHYKSPYAPRTTIRLGYDILQRNRLYTLNSYRFEYGYTWKKNLQTSY